MNAITEMTETCAGRPAKYLLVKEHGGKKIRLDTGNGFRQSDGWLLAILRANGYEIRSRTKRIGVLPIAELETLFDDERIDIRTRRSARSWTDIEDWTEVFNG